MSEPIYSKCGMRCDLCLIYRPNVEKDDRRREICDAWRRVMDGFEANPETVICDGCRCERADAALFDPACKARACVTGKDIPHCGYCGEYPCAIFPAEPAEEDVRRAIEVEKRWTWEDEKLMEAYACKKYMDAFREGRK